MIETHSVYFPEPGSANTEKTLEIAKRRAEQLEIKTIVVASTSGETGVKAVTLLTNYKVVVVTHATGFPVPDAQELTPENRAKILEKGGLILTATHAFGGVGRAIRRRFNSYQVDEIIAHTLRVFGHGRRRRSHKDRRGGNLNRWHRERSRYRTGYQASPHPRLLRVEGQGGPVQAKMMDCFICLSESTNGQTRWRKNQ
jgi:hypothetical protein